MKTFYRYAAIVTTGLLGLCACSSDDEAEQGSDKAVLAEPQIVVSDLTTTGFTLRWNAVDEAGSYVYTFNGGSETVLDEPRATFSDLERQKEYVVAVKACPREPGEYRESPYAYIHVVTDELEQLPAPKITLGSAYASKTVISWSEVPEAQLYEITLDDREPVTTADRTIVLTNLEPEHPYAFTVRAMTSDATRFSNSEPAELAFVTSGDDVPPLLIAPTDIISDAVAFDIYASSGETYYYGIMPATSYVKRTPEQIVTSYQTAIVEYARELGISIQLGIASLLKSGTQSLQIKELTPELSYVIFAFGMDLKGNVTTQLYTKQFRTTADGYSAGPNYGSSDWFTQRLYISNAYQALPPDFADWTNSVITFWKGEDVVDLRYRTLSTSLFNQLFPDPNDKQAIRTFLKDPAYGIQFNPALLASAINGPNGSTIITPVGASGTSYTLLSLATSSSGAETLSVNSVTTKTSKEAANWFVVSAIINEHYGPEYSTVTCAMQGIEVASLRYRMLESAALANVPTSSYEQLVADYGNDLAAEYIPSVNTNGFALRYTDQVGIKPSTSYTFIATATNTVGDKVTKWASATTAAAPADAPQPSAAPTRTDGLFRSFTAEPIDHPEKFIFPLEGHPLPEGAKPACDHWTIFHNTHIIK